MLEIVDGNQLPFGSVTSDELVQFYLTDKLEFDKYLTHLKK